MTENTRHREFLETGKLDLNEGERERNAKRAIKIAVENKGIKKKYLGNKNPFKNDKSR